MISIDIKFNYQSINSEFGKGVAIQKNTRTKKSYSLAAGLSMSTRNSFRLDSNPIQLILSKRWMAKTSLSLIYNKTVSKNRLLLRKWMVFQISLKFMFIFSTIKNWFLFYNWCENYFNFFLVRKEWVFLKLFFKNWLKVWVY